VTTTYTLSTTAGKTRLLIPDTSTTAAKFSDDEISTFLLLAGNDPFLAAALGCIDLAGRAAIVQGDMTVQGITTRGSATCAALMARADWLKSMAGCGDLIDDPGFAGGEYVGIASAAVDEFTYREIVGWT
jgi:hypothetical protein